MIVAKRRASEAIGALAGAVIGAAAGHILAEDAMTAELGQFVWLAMIIAAGAVIASPTRRQLSGTVVATIPCLVSLFAMLCWHGAAGEAYAVGRAVFIYGISIPLSAASEREMVIRYGLFYLFVLVASGPATLASGCACETVYSVIGPCWRRRFSSWFSCVMLQSVRAATCLAAVVFAARPL